MWLAVMLVVAIGYAGWSWWRPYDWQPDPAARYRITGTGVTHDHGYHWVEIHLRKAGAENHDLSQPVRLVLADGRELEPADTRLGGDPAQGVAELTFKFWLEPGSLGGPLALKLNGGQLRVRNGAGVPALGSSGYRFFNSTRW